MKTIHSVLLTVLIYCNMSFSQTCDDCPRLRIALYDSDVQVPRPTQEDSIVKWYTLFWPSAAARSYLHNNDPSRDCIGWIDGALINAKELQEGVLKFGMEYANIPPAGSLKSSEYLLRSFVTGSSGTYTFNLILESGPRREIVKSVSAQFSSDIQSATAAGENAAKGLMSLLNIIRQFEANKRNGDVNIAIDDMGLHGDRIIIKPEKTLVKTGESINVSITMTDCDGVPLVNRKIYFKESTVMLDSIEIPISGTKGGEIIPEIATTDASGNATVQFKVGDAMSTGFIVATYPHYTPCGTTSAFEGNALIQIDIPPPTYWLLTAELEGIYSSNQDTTIKYSGENYSFEKEKSSIIEEQINGKIIAVIENLAEDPEKDFYYSTESVEPLMMMYSGGGSRSMHSKYRELVNGTLVDADIGNIYVTGKISSAGFSLDYFNDYQSFDAGIHISGTAHAKYHYYSTPPEGGLDRWWDSDSDYDYGLNLGGGCDQSDTGKVCWITKSDSGYSAFVSIYEKKDRITIDGTIHSIEKGYIAATVVPYNSITAIKDLDYSGLLPKKFSLSQNFPNPFNPSTIIKYQIPTGDFVTLKIYDILGREVAVLINEYKTPGYYSVKCDLSSSSGVYFYSIKAGEFYEVKKMILTK